MNDRDAFVEQAEQTANYARLALAPLAEEDHVMAGEYGVFDFRDNRFVITDDARQNPFAAFQVTHEILTHFLAHR